MMIVVLTIALGVVAWAVALKLSGATLFPSLTKLSDEDAVLYAEMTRMRLPRIMGDDEG